jgi:DNA-directed RNA polymerase subunit RPC12/RpoP
MSDAESRPTAEHPDDGPDCPDCGATTDEWMNVLDEETGEHTWVIDCPNCGFAVESESNKAHEDRLDRLREESEAGLGPSDVR